MPYSSVTKALLKDTGIDIHTRHPTSPISLRLVTKKMGIKYIKVPMHQNTCGMMVRSNDGPYIAINANHPYTRRRFSTAHEIGHYYLGHESDITQLNDQNRYKEVQANRFASSLLMPDELFYRAHKEHYSIKEMANWLRVSPISVAIRCIEFGLRKFEAELVKTDYYQAIDEVAVTSAPTIPKSSKRKHQIVTESNEQHTQHIQKPLTKYDHSYQLWKYNEKMLDRLRRLYGYE